MIERSCAREEAGLGRPARQCRRDPSRSWCAAACGPMSSPTRPRRTIRSTAICRRAGRSPSGRRGASSDPKAVDAGGASTRWPSMSRAMLEFHTHGRADARLRQQHPPDGARRRASPTPSTFPGFVPAYIRPLFCRGIGPFRWAALSGDPEDIYRTDAKVKELMPDDTHLHNWLDMARAAHQLPGPAGAHLLGRPRRPPPPRPRLQRDGGERRAEGADRDRPRSSRFRLGRLAQPRDRGDAGRLGRGLRLAAAQRAAQLRLAAPPGCRCITAAASAWATRSTPAW